MGGFSIFKLNTKKFQRSMGKNMNVRDGIKNITLLEIASTIKIYSPTDKRKEK